MHEKTKKLVEDNFKNEYDNSLGSTELENLEAKVKKDLILSFRFFNNPKYTGHDPVLPVSMVIFGAPGTVVNPPSFEFMAFGRGQKGVPFEETGGFDLSELFTIDAVENEKIFNKEFDKACLFITQLLQQLAATKEFKDIPKTGPVIFVLSIEETINRVLGRIHPNGIFENVPES